MTTKTSAIPGVIGYLFDTCTAAGTLGASASAPVTVVYGYTKFAADYPRRSLWIAAGDPTNPDLEEVATATQEWRGTGARARDENLTISCYAESWTGDNDLRAMTEAAFAIVAAVEDITRDDPTAGNNTNGFTSPGVTNLRLRIGAGPQGVLAQVLFDFNAFARIGTF